MRKYTAWIYVCADGGITPVVKAYPTKYATKNAVKSTFETYMDGLSDEEKEKARKLFEDNREENFTVTLPEGKTVHCYVLKSSYDYF